MRGARILVVGSGLAGLALARALGRAGFAPELIERSRLGGRRDRRVPARQRRPRSGALGLEEAVAARSRPSPIGGCSTTTAGCWPRSTRTGCGDVGACLALPGPTTAQVLRDGVAVGWAGRSRR